MKPIVPPPPDAAVREFADRIAELLADRILRKGATAAIEEPAPRAAEPDDRLAASARPEKQANEVV